MTLLFVISISVLVIMFAPYYFKRQLVVKCDYHTSQLSRIRQQSPAVRVSKSPG